MPFSLIYRRRVHSIVEAQLIVQNLEGRTAIANNFARADPLPVPVAVVVGSQQTGFSRRT